MPNKLVKTENEHLHASGGLVIPFEVADGITLATLQEQLGYLRKEVEFTEASPKKRKKLEKEWGWGVPLHPEDYSRNRLELIPALETIIKYFGGEV